MPITPEERRRRIQQADSLGQQLSPIDQYRQATSENLQARTAEKWQKLMQQPDTVEVEVDIGGRKIKVPMEINTPQDLKALKDATATPEQNMEPQELLYQFYNTPPAQRTAADSARVAEAADEPALAPKSLRQARQQQASQEQERKTLGDIREMQAQETTRKELGHSSYRTRQRDTQTDAQQRAAIASERETINDQLEELREIQTQRNLSTDEHQQMTDLENRLEELEQSMQQLTVQPKQGRTAAQDTIKAPWVK